ncbi:leucine-rich_repeat domain-containing protein [Hexamita inflata]|uniref:Leucine-rich_repeat domain-containing protein n=1 Tax=Hexamita inflata TaxID=28002 RepID=A0ABP1HHH5_9EUKA
MMDKIRMKQKVTISNIEELYQVLQIDIEKEQLLNNELFDFSAIINTTIVKLDNLDLSQNIEFPKVNTDILCHLKCLEVLKIRYGCFSNIQRLHQLRSLKTIELQYNKIDNISFIAELVNLEDVNLSLNEITDISPLAKLLTIKILKLMNNNILDVSPIGNLQQITYLDLESNKIYYMSSLYYIDMNDIKSNSINPYQTVSFSDSLSSALQIYSIQLYVYKYSPISTLFHSPPVRAGS